MYVYIKVDKIYNHQFRRRIRSIITSMYYTLKVKISKTKDAHSLAVYCMQSV